MKKPSNEDKDFYLIAKKIQNQSSPQKHHSRPGTSQFDKESQEALRMIQAYRKVQNLKPTGSNKINKPPQHQKQSLTHQQPKSTYANKIKQTLRQLNANKAKEYQKLSQKNIQLKSQPKSLQVVNQQAFKAKSEQQKKLVSRAVQKIYLLIGVILKKSKKHSFSVIIAHSDSILQNQYSMAKKYRLFRLFSLWRQQAKLLKIENDRRKKQEKQQQISALQLANEFRMFSVYKKVMKNWAKIAKLEKKKRKYEEQLKQIEAQRKIVNKNQQSSSLVPERQPQSNIAKDPLQNKLKGFLSGLKQKIQHKDHKPQQPLHPITQHTEQSQQASQVFTQSPSHQQPYQEYSQQNQLQNQHQNSQPLSNEMPKQPLSNEALQKNRQQIYQRSKQRKQALQKLKKQKQVQKKKQEEQRKQLEKQIEEENKRIKELKYKQFQQRKKLQKEWEQREIQLSSRADEWNRLRIMKFYGFDQWKSVKNQNLSKAQTLKNTLQKIMLRHAGAELLQNLNANMQCVLECLYAKMNRVHQRNLKKKCVKGFKTQLIEMKEQKLQLEAFHEVHTQKIFISEWKRVLDLLRLENMEQERPLIKKANEYNKVSLLIKSLRALKDNAIESKKEKNINEQKQKIKSKIKNIISEKIQINFDQVL